LEVSLDQLRLPHLSFRLNTIGRQVFADTANTLSNVAEDAAKQIEPSAEDNAAVKKPGADSDPISKRISRVKRQRSQMWLQMESRRLERSRISLKENVSGDQRDTLIYRLRAAVTKLRQRNDYSDSVSTIGLLIQRYAKVYSRAIDNTISTAQENIDTNDDLDRAVKNVGPTQFIR